MAEEKEGKKREKEKPKEPGVEEILQSYQRSLDRSVIDYLKDYMESYLGHVNRLESTIGEVASTPAVKADRVLNAKVSTISKQVDELRTDVEGVRKLIGESEKFRDWLALGQRVVSLESGLKELKTDLNRRIDEVGAISSERFNWFTKVAAVIVFFSALASNLDRIIAAVVAAFG